MTEGVAVTHKCQGAVSQAKLINAVFFACEKMDCSMYVVRCIQHTTQRGTEEMQVFWIFFACENNWLGVSATCASARCAPAQGNIFSSSRSLEW